MTDTIDTTTEFAGRLVRVETLRWTKETGECLQREVVRHPGAVLILAELPGDEMVLIRNRRIAVDDALWEFPAGTLEPGEPPHVTARRELEEETGYRCRTIRSIGEFFTSPGFTDERMHVFLASDLELVEQQLEPHEEIEVQLMQRATITAMIAKGELVDGKSIAAMFLYEQQRTARGGSD